MARVIIDLRKLDLSHPNAPAQNARNLAAALLRRGANEYQVLEPGQPGKPAKGELILSLAGSSPRFGHRNLVLISKLDHLLRPRAGGPLRLVRKSWQVALVTSRADLLLAPSHTVRDALVNYLRVAPARIAICPPGLEPGFVRPPLAEARVALARLGLEGRYLLLFGEEVGPVLEAWEGVEGRPGVRLVRADELPTLARDDLKCALSGALACLYCGVGNGVPLGPLEAMACGSPPIVLGDAAYPEVVRDGGLSIRPAAAVADWRESMNAILRSAKLRTDLSQRARSLAEVFTADRAARLLEPLLDPGPNVEERVDTGKEDRRER